MDNMDAENTEMDVSPHTNRLVTKGQSSKVPTFWCGVCRMKLNTPTHALQHLIGNSHKSKIELNPEYNLIENHVAKRKHIDTGKSGHTPVQEGPLPKRSKSQSATSDSPFAYKAILCKICNLELNSDIAAEMHFKGKKHAQVVEDQKSSAHPIILPGNTSNSQSKTENFCVFCNISLNSEEQMIQHYNGMRHKLNAGIISEPPDRWLANKNFNQRGRAGQSGSFRGDTRIVNRLKNILQKPGTEHVEPYPQQHGQQQLHGEMHGIDRLMQFDEVSRFGRLGQVRGQGYGRFSQVSHGFVQVCGTFDHANAVYGQQLGQLGQESGAFDQGNVDFNQEYDRFTQEIGMFGQEYGGRGKMKVPWSGRGRGPRRGSMGRGSFGTGRGNRGNGGGNDGSGRGMDWDRGRGISSTFGRRATRGQFNRGINKRGMLPKSVGNKTTSEGLHVDHVTSAGNIKATIPGGKGKLSDYFVKKTTSSETSLASSELTSYHKEVKNNPLKTITNKAPMKGILKKTNVVAEKAVVPGGKGALKGYFVSASRKDEFTVVPENERRATVPGGKGILSNYFVSKGTGDFFKPRALAPKMFYVKQNNFPLSKNVNPYTMQRHEPRNNTVGQSGYINGNYYSSDYSSNSSANDYLREYQMNIDGTYDSYYG